MIRKMKNLPPHQKIALLSFAIYVVITLIVALKFISED
ncbi:hypothetical protein BC748_0723 [Flavobacterium dankookense]|uniref:Uncharacterized protein n=1 Tax=Flavobacterium dankookense TaxID=706186 RepID=A0A4R6QGL6_9FLAO|nr:hypothetical protein BC748_0723 [Flavobacterium dankookense]